MSRPRTGVGAELVPLVLILSCLAGSLALIVTVHRRSAAPRAVKPAVAVALAVPPPPARVEAPAPVPVPEPVEEPEPPPPPPVEDPTPKAVARLTSAEAEQLLEASRADRQAAELEAAKQKVDARSAALRQRVALVRSQMDIQETKVRQLEAEADALARERDALEQERDARKAALANRSRPGTAILPHKGPNGTWRRPVVVECRDGMAILQPRGVPFGLLDLASGFGPASNPFVATVAREAIRVQARSSPDGSPVVPYIFFVIRPDGIRPYYEARGRLEPLGITFGYELVDQDAQIEFPDLDDVNAWDGSSPPPPGGRDPLSDPTPPRRTPGLASSTRAEDEEFPSWQPSGRPSNLGGATPRGTGAIRGGDRTFAPTESSGTGPSPGALAQLGSPPLPGRSQIAGGGGPPDPPAGSSGTGSTRPGGLLAMAGPEPLPGGLGGGPTGGDRMPGGSGSPGGMGRGGSPVRGGSGGGGFGGTGSDPGTSAKPADNGLDPLGGLNGPADPGEGSGRSTGSRNPASRAAEAGRPREPTATRRRPRREATNRAAATRPTPGRPSSSPAEALRDRRANPATPR